MRARNLPEAEIRRRLDAVFSGGIVCAEDRLYAMALRGVSQQQVSRYCGTASRSTVAMVISGERVGWPVRQAIAELVGVPENRLWTGEDSVRSVTCTSCGERFQHPRAPGPAPKRCGDCREVTA